MRKELKKNLYRILEEIPARPGVYLFIGKEGTILYVGKAKSLRDRLRSYLTPSDNPRIKRLQSSAQKVETILTDSEADALLLEANLIKRHQPKYNVKLKDDKKYPYLKITIQEPYPRIFLTRDLRDDGSLIFGPFTHARSLRRTLRTIRKIFPIRTCKYKLPRKRKISPCIDYYLGICSAPCFLEVKREDYMKDVQGAIDFLSGKFDLVERKLEQEMEKASLKMEFEKASKIRDMLIALHETLRGQKTVSQRKENIDFVAFSTLGNYSMALILQVRENSVVGKENYLLDPGPERNEKEIIGSFLSQYYSTSTIVARTIIVDPVPEDRQVLEKVLKGRVGEKVRIRSPFGEEEKRLYALAEENTERLLEEEILKRGEEEKRVHPAVSALKETLKLDREPRWIEGVDISQLFGNYAVGSVVVFINGRPKKSNYRRYKIKRVRSGEIDDFRMIEEVVKRRFKRLKEKGREFPDLMLIDGGKGQLHFARKALNSLGVDIPLVAIAKRFDELHLEDGKVLMLDRRSPALRLFQRIRDEAHRFAITYHRVLRKKGSLDSLLDSISGIGEVKRRNLIQYFGSVRNLLSASPGEISKVKGIGPSLAKRIYEFLHGD